MGQGFCEARGVNDEEGAIELGGVKGVGFGVLGCHWFCEGESDGG